MLGVGDEAHHPGQFAGDRLVDDRLVVCFNLQRWAGQRGCDQHSPLSCQMRVFDTGKYVIFTQFHLPHVGDWYGIFPILLFLHKPVVISINQ